MFKHENAPVCRNVTNCRIKKCQFAHSVVNDEGADSETVDDIPDTSDCELCSHTMHGEKVIVNDEEGNFQEC